MRSVNHRHPWHTLGPIVKKGPGDFWAAAVVGRDSPWFQGHFPGNPILPGIAQLELVKAVVAQATGRPAGVEALQRVRYRQMIKPNDRIEISVAAVPEEKNTYKFRVVVEDELACNGTMRMESASNQNRLGRKDVRS